MNMIIGFPGGKRVNAQYKGFTIETDQPETAGGDGTAPAPFDLFLASIGTCAGIYVLSFLQQRGLSAEDARIILRTERNSETGLIGTIGIDVELPPDFPQKYVNAVRSAADLCAVKKHIVNPPQFNIQIKIGEKTK